MKKGRIMLFIVLGSGLILNMWGITFGLSDNMYLHPDENLVVGIYQRMVENKTLNPGFFIYGAGFLYLYSLVYLLSLIFNNIEIFYLFGRFLSGTLGCGAILFTYLICARIFNKKAGLFAAIFHVSALVFVQSCHYIKADIPNEFFLLIAVWFAYRILEKGRLKDYILGGVFSGICVTMKYNYLVIIPLIVASILSPGRVLDKVKKSGISLFIAGVAFIIFSPFAILDYSKFWSDICAVTRQVRYGESMWGVSNINGVATWKWYIMYLSKVGLFYPFIIAIVGGIVILIRKLDKKILFLLSFPLVYAIQIMFLNNIRFDRYAIPLVPFFSIFAGVFIWRSREFIRKWLWGKSRFGWYFLNMLGAGAFFILPMIRCGVMDYYLTKRDTRALARDWIANNLKKDSILLVIGEYQLHNFLLQKGYSCALVEENLESTPIECMSRGIKYILISSVSYHIYKNYSNTHQYEKYNTNYGQLLESAQLIKEINYPWFNWWFSNSFGLEHASIITAYHNPMIQIFKLPDRKGFGLERLKVEYRARDLMRWSNGVLVEDAQSRDGKAVYNGAISGPYETYFKGDYIVRCTMRVDDNTRGDNVVGLDITTGGGGKVFIRKELRGVDFDEAREYQDFILPLGLDENSPLEFRVHYYGNCNLWVECIEMEEAG